MRYFGDKVQRDKNGNITGIALNTSDWDAALNNWFTATYPYSQAYLINEIANGKIACCRLGSDRSHAVVLLGVDADAGKFIYYDPVLGGENNKAAFTEIYDPRIITLNSATHIVRNKFKILSNNILPSILPCQKIHLT